MTRSVSRNDAGRATRPWHQPACKASTYFIRGTEFFAIVQLQSSRSAWRTAAPAHQACKCTCGTCSMLYAANRRHDMGAIIRHGMSCDAGSAVLALLSRCGMDALVRVLRMRHVHASARRQPGPHVLHGESNRGQATPRTTMPGPYVYMFSCGGVPRRNLASLNKASHWTVLHNVKAAVPWRMPYS